MAYAYDPSKSLAQNMAAQTAAEQGMSGGGSLLNDPVQVARGNLGMTGGAASQSAATSTANPYLDLAKGLQGMISNGQEGEAKRIFNEKRQQFGSQFDTGAFAAATANLGLGGPDGFTTNQVTQWAANPNTQAQQKASDEQQRIAATTSISNPTFQANGGSAPPVMADYQKNPYLDQMAAGITSQMNDNWTRNLAPSIRSGAMAAGGFGGSRQGVVESNALNDMNRSLGQNLTNLYGQDYTQDRQRALQKYSADQGFNLGMAGNNLGYANLDANIYNSNFNNSLNAGRFGLDTFNTMNNLNTQGTNNATTQQNAPLNYFNNTSNNTMAAAGTGQPNQVAAQGNPYMAGAGAGLATYGALQNFGMGGNRGYAGGNGTYEYQNPNNSNSPY